MMVSLFLQSSQSRINIATQKWWCPPLIPALRRQRHVDLCELKACLVYKTKNEFQDSQCYIEKPYLENKQTNKQKAILL